MNYEGVYDIPQGESAVIKLFCFVSMVIIFVLSVIL